MCSRECRGTGKRGTDRITVVTRSMDEAAWISAPTSPFNNCVDLGQAF